MARRDSLTSKFSDISLDEPIKIEIEDRELELDVFASDLNAFMLIGQQEDDINMKHLEILEETLRNILQRSYLPYYNLPADEEMDDLTSDQTEQQEEERQAIEGLLTRYYTDIFKGVMAELGWADEEELDASAIKKTKKK